MPHCSASPRVPDGCACHGGDAMPGSSMAGVIGWNAAPAYVVNISSVMRLGRCGEVLTQAGRIGRQAESRTLRWGSQLEVSCCRGRPQSLAVLMLQRS